VKLYQSKEEVPSSYDVIAIMSVEGKAGEEAQFIKAFLYRAADLGADAVIFYRVSLAAGTELGQRYISTSIFTLPSDFDSWPDRYDGVLPQHIEQMRRNLHARDRFVKWAIDAGYSDAAVYRPMIKRWILHKLLDKAYQEKQVDTTVVALLVRSAITHGDDYHCVVTGDADILPAIRVAYPEYSKNVFVATTHPDELAAEHRQTSFSIARFQFRIPPVYLQDHVAKIIQGEYVYECTHCHRVFARARPIPKSARPCCAPCHGKRT